MGVRIEATDDLPDGVPVAAEFGPGYIHLAVSKALSVPEACQQIAGAWEAIRTHYGPSTVASAEARCAS